MTRSNIATLSDAFEAACLMEAPLDDRLAAYAAALHRLNAPLAGAYDELVARLVAGEAGAKAPAVGEEMPPFILPGRAGELVRLDSLLSKGPVVICFNRGHWCSFCRIHIRSIAEHLDEIAALGAEVISIVPDRQRYASRFYGDVSAGVRVLSDIDNAYALSVGITIWLGDHLKELLRLRGCDLAEFHGVDDWLVPLPATFVVDPSGRVAGRHVEPDFRKRMNATEIVRILEDIGKRGIGPS